MFFHFETFAKSSDGCLDISIYIFKLQMGFLRTANITWHIVAKRDVPAAADPKRTY